MSLDFDAVNADKILIRYDIVVESSEKPENSICLRTNS